MISDRAKAYLDSLQRVPALPTSTIERSLFAQGAPCFDAWLDFHDRYAGHVEPLGNQDYAIWGIVHEAPNWLDPGKAHVEREPNSPSWYVTCADVHPSYVYQLDQRGEFSVPPAVSFDTRIERNALLWWFLRQPGARRIPSSQLADLNFIAKVRGDLARGAAGQVVPEASDKYARFYLGSSRVIQEDVAHSSVRQIWISD